MALSTAVQLSDSHAESSTDYRLQIAERVADLNPVDWDALSEGASDFFMDRRFIRAVENSELPGGKTWSVLVYDGDLPVAAACLSLLSVDAALLADVRTRRLATGVRRLFPQFLRFNILFCGLPVSASQGHLLFSPQADRARVLRLLDRQMQILAKRHRAKILVFKEFDATACHDLSELEPLGYVRAASTVVSYLDGKFESLDAYCGAIRSQYRRKILRSQRKFAAAGFHMEKLAGGDASAARYTDEVHRLYEAVVDRSKTKLEVLPAEFFRQLARQFPDEYYLIMAYQQSQVVGFACGLRTLPIGMPLFIGIDYEKNPQGDVYLNLMYALFAEVLSHGVSGVFWGANSEDFKASLGCRQRLNYAYIRATNWLQSPLRWFRKSLFPPLSIAEPLNIFHVAKTIPTCHSTDDGSAPTGSSL